MEGIGRGGGKDNETRMMTGDKRGRREIGEEDGLDREKCAGCTGVRTSVQMETGQGLKMRYPQ